MTPFQKFARIYSGVAVIFFNTALLGAVAAGIWFLLHQKKETAEPEDPIQKYGIASVEQVYPGHSTQEVITLMKEAYERPLIYAPYAHFTELPRNGNFVNVSEAGFRLVEDQGPWPLDQQNVNVFVFGGSTTFGYGVTDTETIPSALQRKLRGFSARFSFTRSQSHRASASIFFLRSVIGI